MHLEKSNRSFVVKSNECGNIADLALTRNIRTEIQKKHNFVYL